MMCLKIMPWLSNKKVDLMYVNTKIIGWIERKGQDDSRANEKDWGSPASQKVCDLLKVPIKYYLIWNLRKVFERAANF